MDESEKKAVEDLLSHACDGHLSEEEYSRLDEVLGSDSNIRERWLSYARLHTELSMSLAADRVLGKSIQAIRDSMSDPISLVDAKLDGPTLSRSVKPRSTTAPFHHLMWFAPIAASLAFMAYMLVANKELSQEAVSQSVEDKSAIGEWSNSTYCAWLGSDSTSLAVGRKIHIGEKFSLFQGVGQLNLANGIKLQIDGPAALVVASESSVILQFGAITGTVGGNAGTFEIAIPSGRLNVVRGEFGVKVDGRHSEVHAFSGNIIATLNPFGALASDRDFLGTELPGDLLVEQGTAVKLLTANDGLRLERRISADRNGFATTLPVVGPLNIPDAYVGEVKASDPLAYWRFETPDHGRISSEMGPSYPLEVRGNVQFHSQDGNSFAEFGTGQSQGYFLSERPLVELTGLKSYSVECWFRPSHYQHGYMVGLINSPLEDPHSGIALELQPGLYSPGPSSGRLRFLHRSPPGGFKAVGNSCFSKQRYLLRRWQHVAAVKDGDELRLYVNGKLSSTTKEDTSLVGQLHMICGLLKTDEGVRAYVGQVDELAVYLHPMSGEEIFKHYHAAPQQELQPEPESHRPNAI